jgi:hypothetical protein
MTGLIQASGGVRVDIPALMSAAPADGDHRNGPALLVHREDDPQLAGADAAQTGQGAAQRWVSIGLD